MTLSSVLDALAAARVTVIGDLMLDAHVYGRVSRISEEAPVPILHVRDERATLGGAGNVAANAASLGAQARLYGLIGADAAGNALAKLIAAEFDRIEPTLLIDVNRPTTLKTRYLGGQHQIMRVDHESLAPIADGPLGQLLAELPAAVAECGALVVSDYGKGVLTDGVLEAIFAEARKAKRFTIVDPKRDDFAAYRGASLITPNRKELSRATGLPCETDDEARRAAQAAIAASGAAILLTRSEKGMSLYRADAEPLHLPAQAREVFDVSGAGDTVVAALAAGIAGGLAIERALPVANAAAGVVVGKIGTATVSRAELAQTLGDAERGQDTGGLAGWTEARARRIAWGAQGLSVGFANGCFDLLHPGHVALLQRAARECDRLIVAINSDASVARLKGPSRPLQPAPARAQVLCALRGVDLVVAFDEDTPLELIRTLQPDVIIKGADYKEADVVGGDLVKARGGRVVLADLVAGQSTTAIAARAGRKGKRS